MAQLILAGLCCVAVGLLLLVLLAGARKRAPVLVVVAIAAAIACAGVGAASLAHASPADCFGTSGVSATSGLTIVQTSTNIGMAPGVAPAAITGRVTNRGDHAVFVASVVVRIVGVDRSMSPAAGPCDISDYLLLAATMPVDMTIGAGASIDFAGASIGFSDTPRDQDGCQGATVRLQFDALTPSRSR
ncbi:MAG: hypothetical protein ABI232_04085 [Jatrophihabitantaceae bacterium]